LPADFRPICRFYADAASAAATPLTPLSYFDGQPRHAIAISAVFRFSALIAADAYASDFSYFYFR
jgi:hypothetical protein